MPRWQEAKYAEFVKKSIGHVMPGIIGTGTGSDYIRTISIPRHHKEACQRLMNPRKLVVDPGVVEYVSNGRIVKRLFVNFAGLGFDAEVVKATTQRFKALGSIPAYLVGLLTTFREDKGLCYSDEQQ